MARKRAAVDDAAWLEMIRVGDDGQLPVGDLCPVLAVACAGRLGVDAEGRHWLTGGLPKAVEIDHDTAIVVAVTLCSALVYELAGRIPERHHDAGLRWCSAVTEALGDRDTVSAALQVLAAPA